MYRTFSGSLKTGGSSTQVIDRDENLFQMLGRSKLGGGFKYFWIFRLCASLDLLTFKLFMMMVIAGGGDCWWWLR